MSKLLLDDQPLLVMPKLAAKIGLNESIILQQIHYWNQINKKSNNNYKDGHYWTFNSIKEWQEQFPFWSEKTIQRTMTNLEKMKLIIIGNYNKLKIDRTKWYRVNYQALTILETSPFGQIVQSNMTEWLNHLDNMSLPLPEINKEINKEINIKNRGQNSVPDRVVFSVYKMMLDDSDFTAIECEQLEALELFMDYHKEYISTDHPKLTYEQWERARETMLYVDDTDLDISSEEEMIRSYFEQKFKDGCDYSVLHYTSGDLRSIRFFDVVY